MEKFVKQTVIKRSNSETSDVGMVQYFIYFLFGILEVLLLFRFILKLSGANPVSAFVGLIYSLTGIFILPFEGIFHRGLAQGVETTAVLEPSTITAIIVYALIAWGLVVFLGIITRQGEE